MAEFLVTSHLEPLKRGQKFEGPLPVHVTILQWFEVPYEGALTNKLINLATDLKPFTITGGEEAMFGPENDVRVRKLRRIGNLAIIHREILDHVGLQAGTLRSPEWAGRNYNPHITFVGERAIEEGEELELKRLELIKREAGQKLKTIELSLGFGGNRG